MTTTTLTKKQKLQAAYDLYRLRLEARRREVEEAVRHTLKGLVELVNEAQAQRAIKEACRDWVATNLPIDRYDVDDLTCDLAAALMPNGATNTTRVLEGGSISDPAVVRVYFRMCMTTVPPTIRMPEGPVSSEAWCRVRRQLQEHSRELAPPLLEELDDLGHELDELHRLERKVNEPKSIVLYRLANLIDGIEGDLTTVDDIVIRAVDEAPVDG